MPDNLLHTYQCSFCKTTAFSTMRLTAPINCVYCLRIMAYKWANEIGAADWQERSRKPIEFRFGQHIAAVPPRPKKCGRLSCQVRKPLAELLNGRFCSEECGALDSIELAERLETLKQMYAERPWYGADDKVKGIA